MPEQTRYSILITEWIEGQRNYFSKKSIPRDRAAYNRLKLLAGACYLVGGVWVAVRSGMALRDGRGALERWLVDSFGVLAAVPTLVMCGSVLLGMGIVAGTLLMAYSKSRGLKEHVKQYQHMEQVHIRAQNRLVGLAPQQNFGPVQEVMRELGKEALAENASWILLHRDRPVAVPT
jgi:hypothetical protein